ncbi:hypothetical protein [Streptomyces sp. WAC07149]|uniref:hypothetical protein n=1 Tax=Streptomyces sp. WAC07149 TaxID=2487425 RepID=UPI00163CE1D3|nr:hypothetical protein [Streptomyces sp. WAC07149]
MAEAVPVRCPSCRRENGYSVPVYPCACGSPVVPPLDLAAPPVPLTHRNWSEAWVTVRCAACGRESEWPHPEVGCGSCGMVVRVPVHPVDKPPAGQQPGGDAGAADAGAADAGAGSAAGAAGAGAGDGVPRDAARAEPGGGPGGPDGPDDAGPRTGPAAGRPAVSRPAFRPVTIRTARDAVVTAALYLRWLGFQDVRQPDQVPIPSAVVDLRAPGVVAQVDPTTAPAGLRAVECVWLNGLTASATSVYFSLAGYTEEARGRADDLGIPLFVMDLTGMPQPVNDPADRLVGMGA